MSDILVTNNADILNPNIKTFEEREKEIELLEEKQIKEKKKSTYNTWVQYNLEYGNLLLDFGLKNPKAKAILEFLVINMDNYNAVMCSYQVLQERFNIAQATVARSIKVLKDNGYIAIFKSGSSNVYAVNDNLYWKSWGSNKKFSKFPANIILSETEQNQRNKEIKTSTEKIKQVNINNKANAKMLDKDE